MIRWQRLRYLPSIPLGSDGRRVTASDEHRALSRRAAREGIVLLKNDDSVLPLVKGTSLALFGKGCADYVKGGGGSGDVFISSCRNIIDGLEEREKEGVIRLFHPTIDFYRDYVTSEYAGGASPGLVKEPELDPAMVEEARSFTDTAVIVISRYSGENWDRIAEGAPIFSTEEGTKALLEMQAAVFEHGDFYLSDAERAMVDKVVSAFPRVIVLLNTGGVMDVSWIADDPRIQGAMHVFQGGMEGGPAVADILLGYDSPSGRLTDTYARRLEDYPSTDGFHESLDYVEYREDVYVGYRYFSTIPGAEEKVVYPFGYGLSYTSFRIGKTEGSNKDLDVTISVDVENKGGYAGRDVVEIYAVPPAGRIGKPKRVLCGFGKTGRLEPGGKECLSISFSLANIATYDEYGIISKASFILEKGKYSFLISDDGSSFVEAGFSFDLADDVIVSKHKPYCAPHRLSRVMEADGSWKELVQDDASGPKSAFGRRTPEEMDFIKPGIMALERIPESVEIPQLDDVADGRISAEGFVDSLPVDVLIDLCGGKPNRGVANTYGIGGHEEYGIFNLLTADGPAGLRILPRCGITTTAWPIETMLASTWDTALVGEVGNAGALEVKENNIGVWLCPAVNIHRSPLCGRNFEYYSEDPLLSGIIGSAFVKGVQKNGIGVSLKHFACNNKETNRKDSDSRVSERALREIYLRQFEIIIRESDPFSVMCSYNMLNGTRVSENHDLLTGILREEWGYKGIVVSDWWTHGEDYLELLAGVNVKMPTSFSDRLHKAYDDGLITMEDLRHNALLIISRMIGLE